MSNSAWPTMDYITCDEYDNNNTPERKIDLKSYFNAVSEPTSFGNFSLAASDDEQFNGFSYMKFQMDITSVSILNGQSGNAKQLGMWTAGLNNPIQVNAVEEISKLTADVVYRVYTVEQAPFIIRDEKAPKGYKGYCIALLDEIANILKFDYEIFETTDGKFGNMNEQGEWNGVVRKLMDKHADIGLGSMSVMAERETVIDFTVPYYDLVGITIMMLLPSSPSSLFKFLTVLETNVWLCILAAYFFTSFLMWVFDRWSPYSYQNNREKYKDDDEKREFNIKECLWFCMTSLTPQGGGEAPKNLSGRLVAATWWLFGYASTFCFRDFMLRITRILFNLQVHHHCLVHRQFGRLLDRLPSGHARRIAGRSGQTVQDPVRTDERIVGDDLFPAHVRHRGSIL